jgi:phosphotransferase system  glucose/maltose/N-acetylglucosamine-specific IIC component
MELELYLISFFSAVIIVMTVHSIIKVLNIALKRKEISKRKHRLWIASSIAIGFITASILPFGYHKILEVIV